MSGLHQRLDRSLFHDVKGLGRGHDLPVAAAGVLYHGIAFFSGDALGGLLIIKSAHGLGRILESGVVGGDDGLGHDGGHGLIHAAAGQLVADRLLQVIPDIALGHGAALREGHVGLDSAGLCRGAQTQIDHTHLRAVAVRHDHLVACGDQIHNRLGGLGNQMQLLGCGVAQRVAAQCDNKLFHNCNSPSFVRPSAKQRLLTHSLSHETSRFAIIDS